MSTYIKVLDKGDVRLVQHYGTDSTVVHSARVSYNNAGECEDRYMENSERDKRDEKLIRYLMKHDHSSPFEFCGATFYVTAPIFVVRQWHRHRTQSYSENSGRYCEIECEFYEPDSSVLLGQGIKNRQGSSNEQVKEAKLAVKYMKEQNEAAFRTYKTLLALGVSKERARVVLPLATYTGMRVTANLWNWFRFVLLRYSPNAQFEIQEYAKAVLEILKSIFPVAVSAFIEKHNMVKFKE